MMRSLLTDRHASMRSGGTALVAAAGLATGILSADDLAGAVVIVLAAALLGLLLSGQRISSLSSGYRSIARRFWSTDRGGTAVRIAVLGAAGASRGALAASEDVAFYIGVGVALAVAIGFALRFVPPVFITIVLVSATLGFELGVLIGLATGAAVGLSLALYLNRSGGLAACWLPRPPSESTLRYATRNLGATFRLLR